MLSIIVSAIFIATVLNLFLKRLGIPTIIGYIVTGTIIAYTFRLHTSVHNKWLQEIGEFGIVFLMFTIGLEFSIRHLQQMKKEVFVFGFLQVSFSAILFALLAVLFLNLEFKVALVISSAIALSSTAIVLKTLNENGDISKPYGRNVLGILLFQDIAVVPILLMVDIFSSTDQHIALLLLKTFAGAVVLLVVLWLVGKYVLEYIFEVVGNSGSSEIFIGFVLLIVISASYFAHVLGFSYSLGAFLAGMLISETHFKHQVVADLIPFRDLLLGVFFITVGMQIDFKIISQNIWLILMLLPVIIFFKTLIIYKILSYSIVKRIALKASMSLFQVGEFALAIFSLASTKNLIDASQAQIFTVVIIITMIMTPFVLSHLSKFADFIDHEAEEPLPNLESAPLKNHTVILGYGNLGQQVASLLKERGLPYVIVEHNHKLVKKGRETGDYVFFGNAAQKDILEAVKIKEAASVVVAIDNSEKIYLVCKSVDELTHNTHTVVKVHSNEEKKELESLNLKNIIVENNHTARLMVETSMQCNI